MIRLISILSILLFYSCSVIKEGIHEASDKKQIELVQDLNGRYKNLPDTFRIKEFRGGSFYSEKNYSLWNVFSSQKGKVPPQEWERCSVKIDFITDKKAEVSLIFEDSIIQSRMIRGKFKDGYFYKRASFFIIPLFPIAFGYNTDRYRLRLDETHNLTIEESWNVRVFLLIAGVDKKAQSFAKFKKE